MAGKQATGPRLLSVVWFTVFPPKFGGQKAVSLFNAYLSKYVPLLCLCSNDNVDSNAGYSIQRSLPVGKSQFFNPAVWRTIYCTAKQDRNTHLLLEFPYHGIAGVLCKRLLKTKLIVHAHNIEYLRFKERGKLGWRLLYQLEKWTMKAADLIFFTTEKDLDTAKKAFGLDGNKLAVAPYGAEEKRFDKKAVQTIIKKRHGMKEGEKILLFAATLDYAPNADAAVAIVEKLVPLLNQTTLAYKVIVCGRNRFASFQYLNGLQHENLVMAGEVADIETYFGAADVFINPVLTGGGVQTKTMDALSYHLSTVCFASKAAGIKHAENKLFVVADEDWTGFATAIITASQTQTATPALFFQTYNWRTIAAGVFEKIRDC